MPRKFSFDERCLDLARYFYPHESDDNLRPLAKQLQDAVEEFGEKPKHATQCKAPGCNLWAGHEARDAFEGIGIEVD